MTAEHPKAKQAVEFLVNNPNVPVKQVAAQFGMPVVAMYRAVERYLDVRKVYEFKSTEKPAEQGSDDELPT